MKGLICNAHFILTSLYFFGKKENGTWINNILFDTMDDPTDVVAAIEEFTNINKYNAVSALDDFVNKENESIFLIKVFIVFDISGKIYLK